MNFTMNKAGGGPQLPPLTLRGVLWTWIKGRFAAAWRLFR